MELILSGLGVTSLCGLYRNVWPQRVYGFSVILVINSVSILKRVFSVFWYSSLELSMIFFLEKTTFFVIIDKTINKSSSFSYV